MSGSAVVPLDVLQAGVPAFEEESLEGLFPGVSKGNTLSAKLSHVLSSSYADSDIRDSLRLIGLHLEDNNAESRRRVRADIQQSVIDADGIIMQRFGNIARCLQSIGSTIQDIDATLNDMRTHVSLVVSETKPTIEEGNDLVLQRQHVQDKTELLKAFTDQFLLSDLDLHTLTSSTETIDDEFFVVLGRVKQIHADCHVLLATENTKAGVEIMEQMTRNLDSAFQKLFHWIQVELKSVSFDSPRINSDLRRAMKVLSERPNLFHNCLDFLAESRQKTLLESFIIALAGDESRGLAKPIELAAHDPLRYIGDILAWVHSSLVSEVEALEVLLQPTDESNEELMASIDVETVDLTNRGNIYKSVFSRKTFADRNLSLVTKAMKSRIEQVVSSHEESTLLYKILHLVNFYCQTFDRVIGPETSLHETMAGARDFTRRQFQNSLQDQVRQVQQDLPKVPATLAVPDFLFVALRDLRELMNCYESSLAPTFGDENAFEFVLGNALDPYLQGCQTLSQDLQDPDSHVFMINCLQAIKNVIGSAQYTRHRLPSLEESFQSYLKSLIEYQHSFFVQMSGLHPLLLAISGWNPDSTPFLELTSFAPASLDAISRQLEEFLTVALIEAETQLQRLNSPALRASITQAAVDLFIEDFAYIDKTIRDSGTEDQAAQSLRLSVGEVRVLLS